MALKVFDRALLKGTKTQVMDSATGMFKLSDNLEAITREINIWKHIDSRKKDGSMCYNVTKIFELIDDHEESKMYLVMEYCKYGTI